MSMRTSSALTLLLLGCDRSPEAVSQPVPEAERTTKIACARGEDALAPVCTLTRAASGQGEIWTIRFPDGGFRRLLVENGEVSAADGAERLRERGDEVVIADERYRLPDE